MQKFIVFFRRILKSKSEPKAAGKSIEYYECCKKYALFGDREPFDLSRYRHHLEYFSSSRRS
jgi:hypothetical protein